MTQKIKLQMMTAIRSKTSSHDSSHKKAHTNNWQRWWRFKNGSPLRVFFSTKSREEMMVISSDSENEEREIEMWEQRNVFSDVFQERWRSARRLSWRLSSLSLSLSLMLYCLRYIRYHSLSNRKTHFTRVITVYFNWLQLRWKKSQDGQEENAIRSWE